MISCSPLRRASGPVAGLLALGLLIFAAVGTLPAQEEPAPPPGPATSPAPAAGPSGTPPELAPEPPPYASWLPQEENPRGTGFPFKSLLLLDSRGANYRDPLRTSRLVDELARSPFDSIAIQVRAFGDAYYTSDIVPRALGLSAKFDPLAEVIKGLKSARQPKKVYAWIELYRVANVNRAIPLPPDHILKQHPEWLSRNAKFQSEDGDGNQYLEPGLDAVQEYMESIVAELMTRYPQLDGVLLDGIRYPGLEGDWGYHPAVLDLWRKETGQADPPAPDDEAWTRLRRRLLSRNLNRLRLSAQNARRGAEAFVVASSEGPAPTSAEDFHAGPVFNGALQDWPAWMKDKNADAVVLLNYRQEGPDSGGFDTWNRFAADLVEETGTEVYPAVAGFANISIDTLSQIRRIQDLGFVGAALSNYLEPVRDSASRELFFRALAKTVFAPDSERLTFLPREEVPTEAETEVAAAIPGELPSESPDELEIEMELPPPPELTPFEESPEMAPLEPVTVRRAEEEDARVASLLDEASEKLAPKREEKLIEPPFQAMEFLRRKFPNIF